MRATLSGHAELVYHLAFSPDGRTLATGSWDSTVRLWHVATAQPLVTLKGHRGAIYCVAFSPDGKILASGSQYRQAPRDVLASDKRLWHAPTDEDGLLQRDSGSAPQSRDSNNPQSALAYNYLGVALRDQKKRDEAIAAFRKAIELDPNYAEAYSNLAFSLTHQKRLDEAIVAYRQALSLDPRSAWTHNGLAWLLATCPDVKLRVPGQAVALAQKAVELDPNHWAYPNTLGVAYYRAGDWKAAIAALEKSMELRMGGDSFDWFFLAMAHEQLGEKGKAREWYDRAAQWMEKNQPTNEELFRFRAEAEELMGIEEKNE